MLSRSMKMAAVGICCGVGAGLTACGDQVTADHDWYSTAAITSETRTVAGVSEQALVLDGPLLTSDTGTAVPGTLVHLECVQFDDHLGHEPYRCLLLLNAGRKVYVAAGQQDDPLRGREPHQLVTLTNPARGLSYTVLGVGTKSAHIKLAAHA